MRISILPKQFIVNYANYNSYYKNYAKTWGTVSCALPTPFGNKGVNACMYLYFICRFL
jgi:hypothetical protein